MSKLIGSYIKPLFAAFSVAVFAAVMFYSWRALSIIFPDDLLGQIFGLLLFDMAALLWFGALVFLSVTIGEYVTASFGFMVGLLGSVGLIAIEVSISIGLVTESAIAKPLTYIFIVVMVGHVVLLYARHASGEEFTAEISRGIERAKILQKAERQAARMIEKNSDAVVAALAQSMAADALKYALTQRGGGNVLDLPALDVESEQPAASVQGGAAFQSFLSHLLNGFTAKEKKKYEAVASAVDPSPQPAQTSTLAAENAAPASGAKKGKK